MVISYLFTHKAGTNNKRKEKEMENQLLEYLNSLSIVSSVTNKFNQSLLDITESVKQSYKQLNNITNDESLELTQEEKTTIITIATKQILEAYKAGF